MKKIKTLKELKEKIKYLKEIGTKLIHIGSSWHSLKYSAIYDIDTFTNSWVGNGGCCEIYIEGNTMILEMTKGWGANGQLQIFQMIND